MVLTGPEIADRMTRSAILCEPLPVRIGPNSIDLRLGDELYVYQLRRGWTGRLLRLLGRPDRFSALDPRRGMPPLVRVPRGPTGGWLLEPGRLYLGKTLEWVGVQAGCGLVPYLDGRSSLARMGVAAHLAAGRGDAGFVGCWTVELVAHEPVVLRPGDELFQMTFVQTVGDVRSYRGGYARSSSPLPSQFGPA